MDENVWLGPGLEPGPPDLETGTLPLSYTLPIESSPIAYFVGGTRGFIPHNSPFIYRAFMRPSLPPPFLPLRTTTGPPPPLTLGGRSRHHCYSRVFFDGSKEGYG